MKENITYSNVTEISYQEKTLSSDLTLEDFEIDNYDETDKAEWILEHGQPTWAIIYERNDRFTSARLFRDAVQVPWFDYDRSVIIEYNRQPIIIRDEYKNSKLW